MKILPEPYDENYCADMDEYVCCPCMDNHGSETVGDIPYCGEFKDYLIMEEKEYGEEVPLRLEKCKKKVKVK